MTFVDGTGEVVEVSREDDPDRFPGLVVHLGAIGIVTSLTLDLVEAVPWHQREWRGLSSATLLEHVEDIMAGADSVSVFTRWQEPADTTILHKWVGDRDAPDRLFGARAIDPQDATDTANSPNRTDATGAPGPWHERIPHFRLGFTPSAGEELQSEWLVDRDDAADALAAVSSVGEHLDRALIVSELRTVAADDLWLSPALGRDVFAIHCTWVDDEGLVGDRRRRGGARAVRAVPALGEADAPRPCCRGPAPRPPRRVRRPRRRARPRGSLPQRPARRDPALRSVRGGVPSRQSDGDPTTAK
jgi:xylitol oxidase